MAALEAGLVSLMVGKWRLSGELQDGSKESLKAGDEDKELYRVPREGGCAGTPRTGVLCVDQGLLGLGYRDEWDGNDNLDSWLCLQDLLGLSVEAERGRPCPFLVEFQVVTRARARRMGGKGIRAARCNDSGRISGVLSGVR